MAKTQTQEAEKVQKLLDEISSTDISGILTSSIEALQKIPHLASLLVELREIIKKAEIDKSQKDEISNALTLFDDMIWKTCGSEVSSAVKKLVKALQEYTKKPIVEKFKIEQLIIRLSEIL